MKTTAQIPLTFKEGVALLGRLDFLSYALMAVVSGDEGGPCTSSPNSARNMSVVMTDVARTLDEIAAAIDPLTEDKDIKWAPAGPFLEPDTDPDPIEFRDPSAKDKDPFRDLE